IEPLYVLGRIDELAALGECGLVVKEQRELAELARIGKRLEIFHDRMGDVELEHRLRGWRLLAARLKNATERCAEIVLPEHQARRRVLQARCHLHFRDALPERVLHALEQRLALLELLARRLAVGFALESTELEVAARSILEPLALECRDLP